MDYLRALRHFKSVLIPVLELDLPILPHKSEAEKVGEYVLFFIKIPKYNSVEKGKRGLPVQCLYMKQGNMYKKRMKFKHKFLPIRQETLQKKWIKLHLHWGLGIHSGSISEPSVDTKISRYCCPSLNVL